MVSKKKHITTVAVLCVAIVISFLLGKLSVLEDSKLLMIQHIVDLEFPLSYDRKKAENFAAAAYTSALNDPYTRYLTSDEYEFFKETLTLSYHGLGVTLDYSTDEVVVVEVFEHSAAENAGIAVGDVIVSVDDYTVTSENYDEIIAYIRGYGENSVSDDTAMHFTLRRNGEIYESDIKRDSFSLPSVTSEMLDNGVFYIELSTFSNEAASEFCETLRQAEGASSIILDLRDNAGGNVSALLTVCDAIMPKGRIFSSVNSKGKSTEYTVDNNDYNALPLVVLVNENSASASEVCAAAIKQSGRGILIGTTTYGKGLVQSIMPFDDGSALRYTSAKYYTYDGSYIHDIGVEPDIEVYDYDAQLDAALDFLNGGE